VPADLTVTLSRQRLVARLFSLLDAPDPDFAVVTP